MTLVMLMGLPASGKSSFASIYPSKSVISLDEIQTKILGSSNKQDKRVLELAEKLMDECLFESELCVLDATNLQEKQRRPYIEMAHNMGHNVEGIYFKVTPHYAKIRNQNRGRKVPDEVIDWMAERTEEPTLDEGFSDIRVIDFG